MKDTLSRLYQLQVLADQLRTTNRRQIELDRLRASNRQDYDMLHRLLNQQSSGLDEAMRLKETIYREMAGSCHQISKIRQKRTHQTQNIDFRQEVLLDKRLTSSQNALLVKFRELNQLLWQLGEPLHHPTYLYAHVNGLRELREILEIERDLQLSFNGYDLQAKTSKTGEYIETYIQRRCREMVALIKKLGGVHRLNTYLNLSESECAELVEDGCQSLIADDQKLLESKLTSVEEKRAARDRVQFIQSHFEASARSYSKLKGKTPRPANYDELLTQASSLSYEEIKDLLQPLLPFTTSTSLPDDPVLTSQFSIDYAINSSGFIQVFQEKYDRLAQLRLRMDRVEELQERELRQEESKVSHKTARQAEIEAELKGSLEGRRLFQQFSRILKARDHYAVAYVKRPNEELGRPFNYSDPSFCSGCNVVISQGLHQKVRRLNEACACDSCNRLLVPFAHIIYVKEEVDALLVSEEERIEMEERGELGLIPACSNCGGELYADSELKAELRPNAMLTTPCPSCHSILIPIEAESEEVSGEIEIPEEEV